MPAIVAAAVLTALAAAQVALVVREYMHPQPGDEVLLEVPSIVLALLAAGAMLVRLQMLRLLLVAGAIGGFAVTAVIDAQVSIGFVYHSAYVAAAALGWMTLILMLAGFVAAWRESGFALMWAVLAAVGGGVAGMIVVSAIVYAVIVIALLMHPLTS